MKGKLEIYRIFHDGKPALCIIVRGNIGQDNRDKLDVLGMTPVSDISNCRQKILYTQTEAQTLRDALIAQEIVEV